MRQTYGGINGLKWIIPLFILWCSCKSNKPIETNIPDNEQVAVADTQPKRNAPPFFLSSHYPQKNVGKTISLKKRVLNKLLRQQPNIDYKKVIYKSPYKQKDSPDPKSKKRDTWLVVTIITVYVIISVVALIFGILLMRSMFSGIS